MMGIVDYATRDDLKYALRKLDDTEFRNPFEKCYIRVKEDTRGGDERDRSRSRSRSRRRAPRRRFAVACRAAVRVQLRVQRARSTPTPGSQCKCMGEGGYVSSLTCCLPLS